MKRYLRKADLWEPDLPTPDASGNYPALVALAVVQARDILRARRQLGLSQAELARRAGIRPETLNRIEQGRNKPSVPTIAKIDRGAACSREGWSVATFLSSGYFAEVFQHQTPIPGIATMPISILCPVCGAAIKAPDQLAGKWARCPAAKRRLLYPVSQRSRPRRRQSCRPLIGRRLIVPWPASRRPIRHGFDPVRLAGWVFLGLIVIGGALEAGPGGSQESQRPELSSRPKASQLSNRPKASQSPSNRPLRRRATSIRTTLRFCS